MPLNQIIPYYTRAVLTGQPCMCSCLMLLGCIQKLEQQRSADCHSRSSHMSTSLFHKRLWPVQICQGAASHERQVYQRWCRNWLGR